MDIPPHSIPPPVPNRAAPTPWLVLLLLAAASLVGAILGSALAFGWGQLQGMNLQTAIFELNEDSERPLRNLVRMANLLNHLATFTLPALFVAFILYGRSWISFFKLDHFPSTAMLVSGITFVILSFPFIQITYWLNHQLPLPDWMQAMEEATQNMIKGLLVMDTPGELIFNLFIIGVLPAIGEELVFRGVVQQQFQRMLRNPVHSIWLTAIIFSAIHFQFEGFLPRMLLGATLGYLFYWTRSLWAPILAHFVTNGMQVLGQYLTNGQLAANDMETIELRDWITGILSLAITITLGYYLWQKSRRQTSSNDPLTPAS